VRGKITIRDDERFVRGIVAKLTHHHEAAQPEPWKMSDAPKDYIADMVKAIVGIEIEIVEITGKFNSARTGKNATPEVSRTISSGRATTYWAGRAYSARRKVRLIRWRPNTDDPIGQRVDAMEEQAARAAPHHHVAMIERNAFWRGHCA